MSAYILIADDDAVVTRLLEYTLSRAGFDCRVCRDAECARISAQEERPAVAVLDLMMPGRTGAELLADFRRDKALSTVPVVMITQEGSKQASADMYRAGADAVYTKPFSPLEITDCVRRLAEA